MKSIIEELKDKSNLTLTEITNIIKETFPKVLQRDVRTELVDAGFKVSRIDIEGSMRSVWNFIAKDTQEVENPPVIEPTPTTEPPAPVVEDDEPVMGREVPEPIVETVHGVVVAPVEEEAHNMVSLEDEEGNDLFEETEAPTDYGMERVEELKEIAVTEVYQMIEALVPEVIEQLNLEYNKNGVALVKVDFTLNFTRRNFSQFGIKGSGKYSRKIERKVGGGEKSIDLRQTELPLDSEPEYNCITGEME